MKHNVLIAVPWELKKVGGVNVVAKSIARQLSKTEENSPYLMENSWESKSLTIKASTPLPILSFPMRQSYALNTVKSYLTFPLVFLQLFTLSLFLLKNKIKVVNFHYACEYIAVFKLLKCFGIIDKLILSIHGTDMNFIKSMTAAERQKFYQGIDVFCFCSSFLHQQFLQETHASNLVCSVIENGVGRDLFHTKESFSLPASFILNVGTYTSLKGQKNLIRAFSRLAKEHQIEQELVLVGKKTDYLDELKKECRALQVHKQVHFFEDIPHECLGTFYDKADIYVSASLFESFGLTLLEAGLYKLPVISTKNGGALEILEHNKTGLLCELDDVEPLQDYILELLTCSDLRSELGQALFEHVCNTYSWESTATKYKSLYE